MRTRSKYHKQVEIELPRGAAGRSRGKRYGRLDIPMPTKEQDLEALASSVEKGLVSEEKAEHIRKILGRERMKMLVAINSGRTEGKKLSQRKRNRWGNLTEAVAAGQTKRALDIRTDILNKETQEGESAQEEPGTLESV